MAQKKLENFLKQLREFSGWIPTKSYMPPGGNSYIVQDNVKPLLASAKTGIPILDTILKNLEVKTSSISTLYLGNNNVTIDELEQLIRIGDLNYLISKLDYKVNITPHDIDTFREVVGFTPQRALYNLEQSVKNNSDKYKHLNVSIDEYQNLPESIKNDIQCIEQYLVNNKNGLTIPLTIGTLQVQKGWILRETQRRTGCQMVSTINGQTTSCKIMKYSCDKSIIKTDHTCSPPSNAYNIALLLLHFSKLPNNNATKISLNNCLLGTNPPVTIAPEIFDSLIGLWFTFWQQCVRNVNSYPAVDVCNLKSWDLEKGIIPFCRMCDPLAAPNSTEYISPLMYPTNVTFKCIKNSTIIDIITDASLTTGINLFDAIETCNQVKPEPEPEPKPEKIPFHQFTQNKNNDIGANYFMILIGIIIVILLILSIVFFQRSKNKSSSPARH